MNSKEILSHLERLDHLKDDPRAKGDWVMTAIELLLRAELSRMAAEPDRQGR